MRELEIIRVEGCVPWRDGYARQQAEAAGLLDEPAPLAKLILLQHAPVYTLGRMTKREHLLGLGTNGGPGPEVIEIDRGGSVTYHGPGHLNAYLLLHLKRWDLSVHQHLWNLEELALRTLAAFGLEGKRIDGMTGVWCGRDGVEAKVCAVGVATRRWITYHGLGLNVDLDLRPFERIDPCGLGRKPVTSLARLLGRSVKMRDAEEALVHAAANVLEARVR